MRKKNTVFSRWFPVIFLNVLIRFVADIHMFTVLNVFLLLGGCHVFLETDSILLILYDCIPSKWLWLCMAPWPASTRPSSLTLPDLAGMWKFMRVSKRTHTFSIIQLPFWVRGLPCPTPFLRKLLKQFQRHAQVPCFYLHFESLLSFNMANQGAGMGSESSLRWPAASGQLVALESTRLVLQWLLYRWSWQDARRTVHCCWVLCGSNVVTKSSHVTGPNKVLVNIAENICSWISKEHVINSRMNIPFHRSSIAKENMWPLPAAQWR